MSHTNARNLRETLSPSVFLLWPKNECETTIMSFLCCWIPLISLDWNILHKLEMNWDKVMRGYSYRGRDYITARNCHWTTHCIYYADRIYWWAKMKKPSVRECGSEGTSAECESKWDSRNLKNVTLICANELLAVERYLCLQINLEDSIISVHLKGRLFVTASSPWMNIQTFGKNPFRLKVSRPVWQ